MTWWPRRSRSPLTMTEGSQIHVDANVILRLLLNQPPPQARSAAEVLVMRRYGDSKSLA